MKQQSTQAPIGTNESQNTLLTSCHQSFTTGPNTIPNLDTLKKTPNRKTNRIQCSLELRNKGYKISFKTLAEKLLSERQVYWQFSLASHLNTQNPSLAASSFNQYVLCTHTQVFHKQKPHTVSEPMWLSILTALLSITRTSICSKQSSPWIFCRSVKVLNSQFFEEAKKLETPSPDAKHW